MIGNQLKGRASTNTNLNLSKDKNKKKTGVKTTPNEKDDRKRPRLPGVPTLDQGVIGQRTAG